MDKNQDEMLSDAVISRAKGCEAREVVEEYAIDDDNGNVKLVKKKVTTKYLPPDISAVKMYLNLNATNTNNYQNMTDDELVAEKHRLLNILKDMEEDDADNQDNTQDEV